MFVEEGDERAPLPSPSRFFMAPFRNKSDLVTTSFTDDGEIAIITLNNPGKLNALTEPMGDQLTENVNNLRDNNKIRAAILTGAGKAFSAGQGNIFLSFPFPPGEGGAGGFLKKGRNSLKSKCSI